MADKVSAYSWPSPWVLGNIPRLPIFSPILLLALEGRYRGILGLIIRAVRRDSIMTAGGITNKALSKAYWELVLVSPQPFANPKRGCAVM